MPDFMGFRTKRRDLLIFNATLSLLPPDKPAYRNLAREPNWPNPHIPMIPLLGRNPAYCCAAPLQVAIWKYALCRPEVNYFRVCRDSGRDKESLDL
jgi:hypothetical protein